MKKSMRLLALLLALCCMTALFAACGNSGETPTEAPATEAPAAPENPPETPEEPEDVEPEPEVAYFPLEEPEEISIWMAYPPIFGGLADNGPADFAFYRHVQEVTNVEIEWNCVGFQSANEQFSAMLAGGDYDDIVFNFTSYYNGSFDGAIEDELIIDIRPFVSQYMPNLQAIYDSDPAYLKDAITDDGHIPSASLLSRVGDHIDQEGMVVDKMWLEKSGTDLSNTDIKTIDQIEEIALMMKDAGCESPIWIPYTGNYPSSNIASAFDTISTMNEFAGGTDAFYYNRDKEVVYAPTTDNYKQYLTLLNKWMNLGLLNKDFVTAGSTSGTNRFATDDEISNHVYGFHYSETTFMLNFEGVELLPIASPVLEEGQKLETYMSAGTTAGGGACVTTSCDPDKHELVFHWLDWFYSDDGFMLVNYGVEGESYIIDENGEPHFTDAMLHPADGHPFAAWEAYYTGGNIMKIGMTTTDIYDELYAGVQAEACDIWSQNHGSELSLPQFSMTAEENEIFAKTMADINTYTTETIVRFIRGDLSLDNDWDNFCATIKERGIDDCLEVVNAAVERYNNK